MDYVPERRRFLKATAAVGGLALAGGLFDRRQLVSSAAQAAEPKAASPTGAKPAAARFTLGFSLYGMNTLPLDEAIRTCASIGYRDIEPALMPGFSADPQQLSPARRKELAKLIDSLGLGVPAVMENIGALAPAEAPAGKPSQKDNVERIARTAELAHDLVAAGSSRPVPVMETVLGGKPDEWSVNRQRILDTLKLWGAAGEKHDLTIAVKAHVSNSLHLPADLKQLIADVGSPRIKAAYDFSHFERQGLALDESLRTIAPDMVFIHVKDGKGTPPKFSFLLPGEGETDYVAYFRLLDELKYRGSVTVEVSGQIFKQPGYDPVVAAKKCYAVLQAAYEKSAA